MNQNKIEFRKVRDFGGLLGVTFDYVKQNFKLLFKSNLLLSGPFILLAGISMGMYQSAIFSFRTQPQLEQFGIPFLFSMLFTILSYLVITIVTYSHLLLYKNSEPGIFNVEEVWSMVKQNFWKLFFTMIGYSIVAAIGFVFLIIPGIYLSIALSIIFIVRLEEQIGFIDAVGRCIKIIKDNWWFTFGLIIVIGIIQGFLSFILYIPNYIVMFFLAFAGIDANTGNTGRIMFIISSIISSLGALFYSLSTIAVAFQYYNLVERKEAPGLIEQIEEIR